MPNSYRKNVKKIKEIYYINIIVLVYFILFLNCIMFKLGMLELYF